MRHRIVPATRDLLAQIGIEQLPRTVEAFVALQDERPVACAGVYLDGQRMVAFSHLTPEVRADRRVIVAGYRRMIEIAAGRGLPLHATPDPTVPGSEALLEHMGFQPGPRGVWICSPPGSPQH